MTARYRTLPHSRTPVSGARVTARLLAAIGFRLYWATEGLSADLYAYRPCDGVRSVGEILSHVWDLLSWTHAAVSPGATPKPDDVAQLREAALSLVGALEDTFSAMADTDLPSIELLGQPFWPVINGPLSDVLTHIGQIALLRRVAGVPAPESNPFEGTAPKTDLDPSDRDSLARRLAASGAPAPDAWARSQAAEGIPQLTRFLFLREAWRAVVDDSDRTWIEARIQEATARPDAPFSGIGTALAGLTAKGATPDELTELVRASQAQLLFAVCRLLDDGGVPESAESDVGWTLRASDEAGRIGQPVSGLHESVLETDPTGREGRPRRTGESWTSEA